MVKNLPANVVDARDMSLIPGSGRSPGGGSIEDAFKRQKYQMFGSVYRKMVSFNVEIGASL